MQTPEMLPICAALGILPRRWLKYVLLSQMQVRNKIRHFVADPCVRWRAALKEIDIRLMFSVGWGKSARIYPLNCHTSDYAIKCNGFYHCCMFYSEFLLTSIVINQNLSPVKMLKALLCGDADLPGREMCVNSSRVFRFLNFTGGSWL